MNLQMNLALAANYDSPSQIARIVTETWAAENLYCCSCLSDSLTPAPNNTKAVDYFCPQCAAPYQLKSGKKPSTQRISDAGYEAMMAAINSGGTPNLFHLHYTPDWMVRNVLLIPSFFFTASAVEKRNPLGPNARRAGWVGCNIRLDAIAADGKLIVIENGVPVTPQDVRAQYEKVRPLSRLDVGLRGWALDVYRCISELNQPEFRLQQIYPFAPRLSALHPDNKNVEPKIRQQLQVLRDAGLLEFVRPGHYRIK